MLRLGNRGVLTVTVMIAAALAVGPSAEADDPEPIPTRAQVDQAEAAAVGKADDVAALRARLVVANGDLQRAAERAEVAAEKYNETRWRLDQARQRTAATKAAAEQALAKVGRERAGIAQLVTQSYEDDALSTASAIVGVKDPVGLMSRLGAVRSAGDAMQARFDEYSALSALARVAQAKAEQAEQRQVELVTEAANRREEATHAATVAQAETERIARERRRLIGELATAQEISVALATKRQEGLEQKAAQAAAAAQAAKAKQPRPVSASGGTGAGHGPAGSEDPAPANPPPSGDAAGGGSGGSSPSSGAGQDAVDFARSQLGEPYRWGADGPDAWDCSGLTMMAWRQAGVSLPHYSAAQYAESRHISASNLRPGDLVFWGSSPGAIHHVALYFGNGQIIHAPRTGRPVSIDSMYYWVPPDYFGRP